MGLIDVYQPLWSYLGGERHMVKDNRPLVANRKSKWFRKELPFHLFLIPAVIIVFLYMYVPMGGLIIAFQKFIPAKGLFGNQKWIGLDNFRYLIHLPGAVSALRNTVSIAFWKIIFHLVIPIIVSILLNELRSAWFRRTCQTLIYLPHFLAGSFLAAS